MDKLLGDRWRRYQELGLRELFPDTQLLNLTWTLEERERVEALACRLNVRMEYPTKPVDAGSLLRGGVSLSAPSIVTLVECWFAALVTCGKVYGNLKDLSYDLVVSRAELAAGDVEEQKAIIRDAVGALKHKAELAIGPSQVGQLAASSWSYLAASAWSELVNSWKSYAGSTLAAQVWVANYVEKRGLVWDRLPPGQQLAIARKVPCAIRCFRVGTPSEVDNEGRCKECGRSQDVRGPQEHAAEQGS